MKQQPSQSLLKAGWGFWLWWVLASTVGWAVGGPLGVVVISSGDIIVAGYVSVVMGGIVTGILQWLVLRRQVIGASRWVLASGLAVTVVGVFVFGLGVVSTDVGWVLGMGLFGTVIGVFQWLVLRGQIAKAGWWVLASTVGWVVSGPVGGFLGWAALGAVFGAITSSVLVWLLRQQLIGYDQASVNPN